MLVLGRRVDEVICIGPDIEVVVSSIHGSLVRLGITAPKDVKVLRKEIAPERPPEHRPLKTQRDKTLSDLTACCDRVLEGRRYVIQEQYGRGKTAKNWRQVEVIFSGKTQALGCTYAECIKELETTEAAKQG